MEVWPCVPQILVQRQRQRPDTLVELDDPRSSNATEVDLHLVATFIDRVQDKGDRGTSHRGVVAAGKASGPTNLHVAAEDTMLSMERNFIGNDLLPPCPCLEDGR
jgi:hypothetical protein